MRLLVDDRWIGPHGIGRFAREVIARLPVADSMPRGLGPAHPLDPAWTALQLARLRPDIYFEPGYNPPLHTQVPYVFTLHDLIHLHVPAESSASKRLYYDRVVKPAVRRAHRVLSVSEFSKKELIAWAGVAPEKVVVVGNGVSDGFHPRGPRFQLERPYLLYVGNRRPHKNVPALLAAFAASGCAREIALLLSGERDRETAAWIRAAGLTDAQVRFAGAIDESRLPDFFRGALGVMVPSLYEGFGLPALEAMACGAPVLAADSSALPEVVGDAALLVDPKNKEALAEGIRRLVEDSSLRESLAGRGPQRAARFDWDKSAGRVLEVLAAAMGPRR
jgi:glycosyltransferase involved in cell wall biosynthesis